MKKVISALLTVIMLAGMITAEAYEFKDSDILIIDAFDQTDENSLESWFVWLPMDTYNHKTYHDMFESDFAGTLHELLIPFDTGVLDTNEAQNVLNQYGLTKTGLEKVYYLDEIQQTFNAVYNTNIDFSSLDGLLLDGSSVMARVINNYFIVYESPHGTIVNPNPKGGTRLGSNSEYWVWYYADDFNTRDNIYTIITCKNVAGYDVRTIDYISFTPPSDEILDSYAGQDINDTPISVTLNGNIINFDQPPIMQNDRTLVPLRAIFEALGAAVTWDDYTETVTATRGYVTINITIGEYCMYKNGNYIELDVPAMLLNDRTLVPVRAISEAFNCIVDWDESAQTVIITKEVESDYNQEDLLRDFLYNRFEQQPLSVQANAYFDIDEDNEYISLKRSATSYEFIDLDNDGMNELIISSGAIIDDDNYDEYVAPCISVWDCDDNGNVVCALAKSGQESRMAYRYFVIRYLGNIYLLESTGESNSDGHTSVRNLYEYSGEDFCFTAKDKVYLKEKLDSAYASEERFTVNGKDKTREYAQEYINGIDQSEFLYRQFN